MEGVLGFETSSFPPTDNNIYLQPDDGSQSWEQEWTLKSHEPILLTENGSPNQEWQVHYVLPPYNYALNSGFPGGMVTVNGESCLSSALDPQLAKAAMHHCDTSMSLLLGSQTSLGTLRAIADDVEENGGGMDLVFMFCHCFVSDSRLH